MRLFYITVIFRRKTKLDVVLGQFHMDPLQNMLHNNTSVASRSRFGKTGLCGGAFTRSLQSPRVAEACWGVNLNSLGTVRLSHARRTAESSRVETFRFRFVIFHSRTRRKQVLFFNSHCCRRNSEAKIVEDNKKNQTCRFATITVNWVPKKVPIQQSEFTGNSFCDPFCSTSRWAGWITKVETKNISGKLSSFFHRPAGRHLNRDNAERLVFRSHVELIACGGSGGSGEM